MTILVLRMIANQILDWNKQQSEILYCHILIVLVTVSTIVKYQQIHVYPNNME